jgi:hypothetical protein
VQELGDEPDRRVAAGRRERLMFAVGGFGDAAGEPPGADDVEVLLPPARPRAGPADAPPSPVGNLPIWASLATPRPGDLVHA